MRASKRWHPRSGFPPSVRLAADFYAAYPDEIDRLIDLDEEEAGRARLLISRRDQLLTK